MVYDVTSFGKIIRTCALTWIGENGPEAMRRKDKKV